MLQVGYCAVVLASCEEGQGAREFDVFDSVVEMRPLRCQAPSTSWCSVTSQKNRGISYTTVSDFALKVKPTNFS